MITSTAALWFGITILAIIAALKKRREKAALARSSAEPESLPPPASDRE